MVARRVFGLLLVAAVTAAVPSAASAALVVTLQPTAQTVAAGSTNNFFDVFVSSVPGGDVVTTYSISMDLAPAGMGVAFRAINPVTIETLAPDGYIFGTGGNLDVFPGSPSNVQYLDGGPPLMTTVATGQAYGAGRVFFDVAANATPGIYTFTINPALSQFLDPQGTAIATAFSPGTVTVVPAGIPEPSSALLLALTGVAGYAVKRRRRSRAIAA